MDILPKNIINKIFLFLRHPAAEILTEEGIFLYMKMRLTPELRYRGSPFNCAESDTCYNRRNNPRQFVIADGRRNHTSVLTDEDDLTYLIVYNHATLFIHHQWGFVTEWSIKGKGHLQPYALSIDYSDTDDGSTITDSDSD